MRNAFRDAMVAAALRDPSIVFMTGDLGFGALEPVCAALGPRFINTGVAEQNMVGLAAGMARMGLKPWAYSIAPFATLRPFEQIRNDICMHSLPVTIVGNGGGYAYGVMGPSHHALEDYGCLASLPNMRCFVPAFDGDIGFLVDNLPSAYPSYLRLGLDRTPNNVPAPPDYQPWRCIRPGAPGQPLVVAMGPIAGLVWSWLLEDHPEAALWVASEMPIAASKPDAAFLDVAADASAIITIEEHVRNGGFGEGLIALLAEAEALPKRVKVMAAPREHAPAYGSQIFCLEKHGLGRDDLLAAIRLVG